MFGTIIINTLSILTILIYGMVLLFNRNEMENESTATTIVATVMSVLPIILASYILLGGV
jgi:hypothetical protein